MNDRLIKLSRGSVSYLGTAALMVSSGFSLPVEPTEGALVDADLRSMRIVEEEGGSVALEIAARTFQRLDAGGATGPTVTLVGVSHIGRKQMYHAVQEVLDLHEVVLYESIKPPGTAGAGGTDEPQRIASTEAAMRFVAGVLGAHHQGHQQYPADLEELIRFAAGRDPRLKSWLTTALVDAWDGNVLYQVTQDRQHFTLVSLGPDGRPGGEGLNTDLRLDERDSNGSGVMGRADDNLQAELAKALGLEFQLEALDYGRLHFRCSDMAMDQLEQALRAKGVDFAPIRGSLAGSSLPGKLGVFILRLIRAADVFFDGVIADAMKVVLIELFADEAVLEHSMNQFGRGFMDVIIEQRNQIVMDDVRAIVQREPDVSSIAILYGAGHMPDMTQRLADQLGYRPTSEKWLTAFKVDLKESGLSAGQLHSIRRMVRQQLGQFLPPATQPADQ